MTDDHPVIAAYEILAEAVEGQKVVTFKYCKKPGEEPQTRMISPYEVTGDIAGGNLKVLGWDHEKDALRSFSIDQTKMADVEPADAEFRAPVE